MVSNSEVNILELSFQVSWVSSHLISSLNIEVCVIAFLSVIALFLLYFELKVEDVGERYRIKWREYYIDTYVAHIYLFILLSKLREGACLQVSFRIHYHWIAWLINYISRKYKIILKKTNKGCCAL